MTPLSDESLPAVERLSIVFGRLLRLAADQRPVVNEVMAAAAQVSADGELGRFLVRRPRSARSIPEIPGCSPRC